MNTDATSIRRGIAAATAATAFFAFAACGTEIEAPAQDIGGTQQEKEAEQPAAPRTTVPHTRFGDEHGIPTYRPTPKRDADDHDPIDRTQDWH